MLLHTISTPEILESCRRSLNEPHVHPLLVLVKGMRSYNFPLGPAETILLYTDKKAKYAWA